MFLYDKKEKSLDVYSFVEDSQAIREYRQSKILEIPERDRVVVAESYSQDMSEIPLFEFYAEQFDINTIPMEYANSQEKNLRYHLLKKGKTSKRNRDILLDKFYSGELTDRNIARIQDLDKIRYYLLYEKTYKAQAYDNRLKRMKNIIELPESLYLLQMLEQEKFSLLEDKDILEQLSLFSLTHLDELNLSEIKRMADCGLTNNSYEQIIGKASNDAHVLNLIKSSKN